MSVPHTGRLVAEIDGQRCTFNGDVWKCPTPELEALLNDAMLYAVKHHYSINNIAEGVFYRLELGSRARIVEWEGDAWPTELPPGAED